MDYRFNADFGGADMSAVLVYITTENKAEAEAIYDKWTYTTPENLEAIPHNDFWPFHPGAEKYYKEKGWID